MTINADRRSPMVDDEMAEALNSFMGQLQQIDDETDGWTFKTNVRQTGVTLNFKFEKKVDIRTAMMFAALVTQGPGRLANATRLLLGEDQVTTEDAPDSGTSGNQEGQP